MKASKSQLKKYIFFFALTFAICFGTGLLRGAFPNEWRIFFGRASEPVILLTSSSKLIPHQTLLDFEKIHGVHIQSQSIDSFHLFQSEALKADLLLAPLDWISEQNPPHRLPRSEELQQLLDEDFRSLSLSPGFFLPLFWQVSSTQELTLWGFYTLKETALHAELSTLLQYLLLDGDRMAGWVLKTGYPSTLTSMSPRNDLSQELKPIYLRDFQLQNLKIKGRKPK